MTYEEFEIIVLESLEGLNSYTSHYYGDSEDAFYLEDDVIIQKHVSGGASGGNCWGSEAEHFSNNKPPQEFLPLEKILTAVNPEITYLKYREIHSLIREGSDCDREYYGNYTDYITFSLDTKKLYNALFPDEKNE